MNMDVTLRVEGQTLVLLPERAAFWLERRTVVVADTHFGKGSVFRAHGMAVPAGADDRDRARLNYLVQSCDADRLIVLGDFLHGPLPADSSDMRCLEAWSESLRPSRLVVIAGNHDRGVRGRWQPPFDWMDEDLREGPFRFTHDVDRVPQPEDGSFTLSGHVHPVVRLHGIRKRGPRVPVFWQHARGLILPSFGVFTGGQLIEPAAGDQVFAAAPERVVPFPPRRPSPQSKPLE